MWISTPFKPTFAISFIVFAAFGVVFDASIIITFLIYRTYLINMLLWAVALKFTVPKHEVTVYISCHFSFPLILRSPYELKLFCFPPAQGLHLWTWSHLTILLKKLLLPPGLDNSVLLRWEVLTWTWTRHDSTKVDSIFFSLLKGKQNCT